MLTQIMDQLILTRPPPRPPPPGENFCIQPGSMPDSSPIARQQMYGEVGAGVRQRLPRGHTVNRHQPSSSQRPGHTPQIVLTHPAMLITHLLSHY